MMNYTLVASAALTAIVLKSNPAGAHGGGLDAYGCHTNRKTGDYHCHGGGGNRRAHSPIYRAPQAPQSYTEYRPKVESKPAVDFTCVGSSFQDPTDSNYTYCPVSEGYGISKGGSKTGIAADGSAAYAAIKAVEPDPVRPSSSPTLAATQSPSERPSTYGYVFRAFIGTLSAFYFGVVILSKDMRESGGGWHFLWAALASWSMACAIGVVSISAFLCAFVVIVIILVAVVGALV